MDDTRVGWMVAMSAARWADELVGGTAVRWAPSTVVRTVVGSVGYSAAYLDAWMVGLRVGVTAAQKVEKTAG